MVKFFNRKLFIIFLIIGGLFSFILGLFSRSTLTVILIKAVLTALLIGAFGLGLDLFLINAVGEEEYEKIFKFSFSKPETSKFENSQPTVDIKEEISDEEKKDYENIFYKNQAEEDTIQSEKGNYAFTSSIEPEEAKIEVPSSDSNNVIEESNKLKEMERELRSSRGRNYTEGEVSFQVKNRRINTTPEVVAKAIKTILKKDEG